MAQLVDHFLTGLTIGEGEHCPLRRKQEHRLTQLLAELLDTERKYVDDLETVCQEYLPLAGETRERYCRSLDRRRKRLARHGSHTQSWPAGSRPRPLGEVQAVAAPGEADIALTVSSQEVRQMLGNIEDLRDFHRRVMLPRMEEAVGDASLMRKLFQSEQQKLMRKYGRYCVNNRRSSIIIENNLQLFSLYQFQQGFPLRVDAQLIKPIQRLTRYHMFLSSLSKTCAELGLDEASHDFSLALEAVLESAGHTNTMMWIGTMEDCPLDLSGQGQLLRHGPVQTRPLKGLGLKARKWSGTGPKTVPAHLFLFQQTIVLCRTGPNTIEPNSPKIFYASHISVNQVRVRDVIDGCDNTFEVHKLENIKAGLSVMGGEVVVGDRDTKAGVVMRLLCSTESEKEEWVRAINGEVKQLRSMANTLSSQLLQLPGGLAAS